MRIFMQQLFSRRIHMQNGSYQEFLLKYRKFLS